MKSGSVISFIILIFLSTAFSSKDECKELIRVSINKFNEVGKEGKGLQFEYQVRSYALNDKKSEVKDNVILKMWDRKSYMVSNTAEIFKDAKHQVSILKANKTIFIAESGADNFSQKALENMILLQGDMLKNGTISQCLDIVSKNVKLKEVSLIPETKVKQQKGLLKMTFLIDPNLRLIKEMKMNYIKDGQERETVLSIIKFDEGFKSESFPGSAIEKVLDRQDKILSAFKGYHLADVRQHK